MVFAFKVKCWIIIFSVYSSSLLYLINPFSRCEAGFTFCIMPSDFDSSHTSFFSKLTYAFAQITTRPCEHCPTSSKQIGNLNQKLFKAKHPFTPRNHAVNGKLLPFCSRQSTLKGTKSACRF